MGVSLKIGLVLPSTPGYSESFFRSKIDGLLMKGHQVTLFTGRSDANFALCPVVIGPRVSSNPLLQLLRMAFSISQLFITAPNSSALFFRLERKSGRSMRTALENLFLNSHILTRQLDWLHFGFATMAVRRENVAQATGARMGVSLRGYDISVYPLKHPGCYDTVWKQTDKVHTISDDLKVLACNLGLPEDVPVHKITPAINTLKFSFKNDRDPIKKPLQILTVARLHWKKGLEYTLKALALLSNAGVDFEYAIIGEGVEYERLCFAAYQLGIRDRVHFLGKQSHGEVKGAMEDADIYLQYSIQEGFCNAVLEAQAMGLLCIVSDAEGLPENVLHGQTGWVVPKRQPGFLAKKILEVLGMHETKQQEIRDNAIDRVRKEFNLVKQQKEFLEFYAD